MKSKSKHKKKNNHRGAFALANGNPYKKSPYPTVNPVALQPFKKTKENDEEIALDVVICCEFGLTNCHSCGEKLVSVEAKVKGNSCNKKVHWVDCVTQYCTRCKKGYMSSKQIRDVEGLRKEVKLNQIALKKATKDTNENEIKPGKINRISSIQIQDKLTPQEILEKEKREYIGNVTNYKDVINRKTKNDAVSIFRQYGYEVTNSTTAQRQFRIDKMIESGDFSAQDIYRFIEIQLKQRQTAHDAGKRNNSYCISVYLTDLEYIKKHYF